MSELTPGEQRRFGEIVERLHEEDPALFTNDEFVSWNIKERLQAAKKPIRRTLAATVLVAIFGGGAASIVAHSTESMAQRQEATNAVLRNASLLSQLKICRYELEAQASLLESRADTSGDSEYADSLRWQSIRYRSAALGAPMDYASCDSGGKVMYADVGVSGGGVYAVSSVDITSFEVSEWCSTFGQYRRGRNQGDAQLAAGEDMMRHVGHPCN